MRLRAVAAAALLQLAAVVGAARVDSGDFGSVLKQVTKGNRMEQCPCVRPPEGGACISYDSRYQASHVEEAMISFVDLTLPDRERPTDADSLACVSPECRACFSLLFYRIQEVGLLPSTYRPAIPVIPKASLNPSMCPRLRFPSSSEFAQAATAALSIAAPSAAIAGLIERGSRFERSAQAAAAASAALSHLKDLESKHGGHHHDKKNKNKNRDRNQNNSNNNSNNSNNSGQTQVTAAQQQGQGRSGSSTPQPSRQVQVQQQLRVQQPSWQQQQQMAQQAQQARIQQQQQQQFVQQPQPQQQGQFNTQQQFNGQQQQFNPQQQQFNPNQQFNNQFNNQFNPQDQLQNAARFLQTARQINTIADSISMATQGGKHLLDKWRPPPPNPGGGHGSLPGGGPRPQEPGTGHPNPGSGSSESGEHGGGYPDHPGHGHHHHHHGPLQQVLPEGPRGLPRVPSMPQLPFGNNAGAQAGVGGPQGGLPPLPGVGGGQGQGGGGGGGWHFGGGWRRTRSSPLERRRRAILASQTGAAHKVEMEVTSPLFSPLIPKELRPAPVEITFNHDAEHVFSEERSAFAEMVRDKRQDRSTDDGILGSRFTIACFNRGESENGGDDKMLSLCGGCWVWRRLPEGFFPPIMNELICKKEDRCLSGWGRCVDKTRSVNVLRKVKGQWTAATLSTGTCCDCKVVAGSEIHSLIVG